MNTESPIGRYIYEKTKSWFDAKVKRYDLNGFYNWDAVSAVYLLEKDFFIDHEHEYHVTSTDLERGYLGDRAKPLTHSVNLPEIRNADAFIEELYESWLKVKLDREKVI